MSDPRVLISGDYWHEEFQRIVASFPVSVTLSPLDRLTALPDQTFDLIVLAQARPDQISLDVVEQLQRQHPNTPLVALLGSWCEGGKRSDVPWPGVRRVYWHQWNGQFDQFTKQLAADGLSVWHQRPTATESDDAINGPAITDTETEPLIVVSAADQTQFEYLRDTIEALGWQACWAERATLTPQTVELVSAACVDGNSFGESLLGRVQWLKSKLPNTPVALALNFPRTQDVERAAALGIHDIVSKPFQPTDLKYAIKKAMTRPGKSAADRSKIPPPHTVRSASRVN